jgi:hypothetical protein
VVLSSIKTPLASMSCLILGLMAALFGVALAIDGRLPGWVGLLGVAGGTSTVASGLVIAYTGFSSLAMVVEMPGVMLVMAWMIVLGVLGLKRDLYSDRAYVRTDGAAARPGAAAVDRVPGRSVA